MELKALWTWFLRRWWLIVLPPLVVGALVVPQVLTPPPGGFSTALHFTAAQQPDGSEPTYEDAAQMPWTASEYLVNSLTAWVTTGSFSREVSAALAERGIDITPDALRGAFVADNARSVMVVHASWPDAAQLQAIAEAAVTVLQDRNQDYFPQLAADAATVTLLDDIAVGPVPPSLMARIRPLFKAGLALLAGIALAALVEYLDDAVYTRDDLAALDLPTIGEIPHHRGMTYN